MAKLSVCRCDIADLDVEAVVSPSAPDIKMRSGVAAAIRAKGGDSIADEAGRQGPVAAGEAIVTGAGNLRARYVIHAVVSDEDLKSDPNTIRTATRNALRLASQRGFKSIALPVMTSGLPGVPLSQAARVTAEAIREELRAGSAIEEVTLAAQDAETEAIFKQYVDPEGEIIIDRMALANTRRTFLVNPVSLLGITIAVFAVGIVVVLMILNFTGLVANPYTGILAFIVGPLALVLGLVLIPIGIGWARKRGDRTKLFPVLDLNQPRQRRRAAFFGAATFVILLLMAVTTWGAADFMESDTFCGQVCHAVMEPEDVAHAESSHARVPCVNCHIGPGAEWLVRAKITGIGQVIAVATNSYPRPIPVPLENLRPARGTCEECHWPEQFHGNRLTTFPHFADDEKNTDQSVSMIFRVGGASAGQGIHWHTAAKMWYLPLTENRMEIGWVRVENLDGTVDEYALPDKASEATPDRIANEQRFLDCIDCHNRAAHKFRPMAAAVDQALLLGQISKDLPFIKQQATQAVGEIPAQVSQEQYDQTVQRINAIEDFYRTQQAQVYQSSPDKVRQAVDKIRQLYEDSVFPHMNATPVTYPELRSHEGCFRCHGTLEGTSDRVKGKEVRAECTDCHFVAPGDVLGPSQPANQ